MAVKLLDTSDVLLALGLSAGASVEERAMVALCVPFAVGAVKKYLRYDPALAERTEYYPNLDLRAGAREVIWEVNDTEAYARELSEASTNELQVRHLPIRSIGSLKIDYDARSGTRSGSFGSETVKVEGVDFWPNYDLKDSANGRVCNDGIIRSVGRWPSIPGSVEIRYTAGYTSAELRGQDSIIDASQIWGVALNECTRRFQKLQIYKKRGGAGFSGPLQSESLGDYSYTVASDLLSKIIGGMQLSGESQMMLDEYVNMGVMLAS